MNNVWMICLREGCFSETGPVPTRGFHGFEPDAFFFPVTQSVWIYQMHWKSCPKSCLFTVPQKALCVSWYSDVNTFQCKQYGKYATWCIRWICALLWACCMYCFTVKSLSLKRGQPRFGQTACTLLANSFYQRYMLYLAESDRLI